MFWAIKALDFYNLSYLVLLNLLAATPPEASRGSFSSVLNKVFFYLGRGPTVIFNFSFKKKMEKNVGGVIFFLG